MKIPIPKAANDNCYRLFRDHPAASGPSPRSAASAEATTVSEDGCLGYRFYQALSDDCSFVAVESWRDLQSLKTHLAAPHIAELSLAIREFAAGPIDVRVYDATAVNLT